MKSKFLNFLILIFFFFTSCQLEEEVVPLENEQGIETADIIDKDKTGNTSRIQCFGQPTCSGAISIGVMSSSEKDTFLMMYENEAGEPRFQYVTKGSYLEKEVKLYKYSNSPDYYFKLWFKNKYVAEPGMEYIESVHPYPLTGVRTIDISWSFQYP